MSAEAVWVLAENIPVLYATYFSKNKLAFTQSSCSTRCLNFIFVPVAVFEAEQSESEARWVKEGIPNALETIFHTHFCSFHRRDSPTQSWWSRFVDFLRAKNSYYIITATSRLPPSQCINTKDDSEFLSKQCYAVLCHIYAVWAHVVLCYCYALLLCLVLCCVVLCYCYALLFYAILCYAMLCYIHAMQIYLMLSYFNIICCYVVLCLRCAMICYSMLLCVVLCCVTAMLRFAIQCYAMLCYCVLSCIVLCCVVLLLCYAILCYCMLC